MRGSVKIKDKWQLITLAEEPELLSQWLWAHDGKEAICIDDRKQVYYCATDTLKDTYKKGGKKAAMFWDLELELRKKIQLPTPAPSADNPYWCATYSLACSARPECREDCCYKPIGG